MAGLDGGLAADSPGSHPAAAETADSKSDPSKPAGSPRILGVVGTLVWDTIRRRDLREAPVEEWGGIGYALQALSVSLPREWEIRPIVKLGHDLSEAGLGFLHSIPGVQAHSGVKVVSEPNNRVELDYSTGDARTERLTGGVRPWSWNELEPLVEGCDALYVNFISGFEMPLEAALALRGRYAGPIWADLHSLFLGVGDSGLRISRPLHRWAEWLRAFDAVQLNEHEFGLLGDGSADPWTLAAQAVGRDLGVMTITLGSRGAAYVADEELPADPLQWSGRWGRLGASRNARSARVEGIVVEGAIDPTGCGDVWGSTTFARLLAGDGLPAAMVRGNQMAARNVMYRGAVGLRHHLQGRIGPEGVG